VKRMPPGIKLFTSVIVFTLLVSMCLLPLSLFKILPLLNPFLRGFATRLGLEISHVLFLLGKKPYTPPLTFKNAVQISNFISQT
jgi:hypothetical protein